MRFEILENLSLVNYKTICSAISYEKIEKFIKQRRTQQNAAYICASKERMQQYIYDRRREKSVLDFLKNELSVVIRKITKQSADLPIKDGNALLAIIHRLFESGFKDNPIMFFKLIGQDSSAVYIRMLKAIDVVLAGSVDNKKVKELENIKKEISEAKAELEKTKSDFAEYYNSLRIAETNQYFDVAILQKISSIQLYDKSKTNNTSVNHFFSKDHSYDFTSLCKVISITDKKSGEEKIALKRLADIIDNGMIIPFVSVKTFSGDPKDRDIIYYSEGPVSVDTVGIWKWRATQNKYDSVKIYIESSYCMFSPVEVIISKSSFDIKSLLQELESGIKLEIKNIPCIYSIYVDKKTILGFLLSNKNCSCSGNDGLCTINDTTVFLDLFLLSQEETIIIDEKRYYRSMNLKDPIAFYRRKSVIEIIKDTIIKRATWAEFKKRDISSKAWNAIKGFLKDLPVADMISIVAADCKCSLEEAKEYYALFVNQCNSFIDDADAENSFFMVLLDNHPELMERCSIIASEKWQKQNSSLVDKANLAISELNSQIEQQKLTLADTERLLSERKEEITELDVLFASKQKMAEDVERKIADKISKAREDAAEFISEMAFVSSAAPTVNSELSKKVRLISGTEIEKESIHEYSSTGILLDIIAAGLDTVGVTNAGNIQTEFAAFLYSAYTERIPLLLAGPCGSHIADALSTSLFGRTAAQIDCAGDVDDFDFTTITDNSDRIIVFNNALNGDWLNKIVAFSMNNGPDKYCILTTPFSEDMAIEPKGLLNYVVPFFTELIISQKGEFNFFGGNPSDDFAAYNSADPQKYSHEMLSEIGLGIYTKNVFRQILSNVSDLIERKPTIDALLFYAAADITGKLDPFSEYINNKLSDKEIKKLLENYLGE